MKNSMSASRLRMLLSVGIVGIVAAVAGGFFYAQQNLSAYASEISKLNADAESGDTNVQTLKNLQKRLAQEQATIRNARSIVADSATYSDQVIGDITRIAAESGVEITSFGFVDASGTSSGTTAPAAAPVTPTTPTAAGPSGVTKKVVSVTLKSPLRYSNLMNFIRSIESNDLKMQFASVNMTKDEGDMVATQTFSIEVYVR